MTFFNIISDKLIDDSMLNFTISKDGDQLTVSLWATGEADINVQPLIISGTPNEVTEKFYAEGLQAYEQLSELIVNKTTFEQQVEAERKEQEEARKNKTAKKGSTKTKTKAEQDAEKKKKAEEAMEAYIKEIENLIASTQYMKALAKVPEGAKKYPESKDRFSALKNTIMEKAGLLI